MDVTYNNSAVTVSRIQLLALKQQFLTPRARDAHKGLYGHVLIMGGDKGMTGAPLLAGYAALRVGAGKVSVVTRPEHTGFITAHCPELMCHDASDSANLQALIANATTIVIGPGLGQADFGRSLLSLAISSRLPLIVDADGLNLLAHTPQKNENWILTPHVAEAARLLQTSTQSIQRARTTAVIQLQQNFGGVAVLKGSHSVIYAGQSSLDPCEQGNPGMASPGMGDVLSGVIGGLVAQGLPLSASASLGVCLHATAGDLAAAQGGERGLIASDLLPFIRQLAN